MRGGGCHALRGGYTKQDAVDGCDIWRDAEHVTAIPVTEQRTHTRDVERLRHSDADERSRLLQRALGAVCVAARHDSKCCTSRHCRISDDIAKVVTRVDRKHRHNPLPLLLSLPHPPLSPILPLARIPLPLPLPLPLSLPLPLPPSPALPLSLSLSLSLPGC